MSAEDFHPLHGAGEDHSSTLSSFIATATSSVVSSVTSSVTAAAASATSTKSCVVPEVAPSLNPIVGNITWHNLAIYIAGPASLIACVVALWLTIIHAANCYRVHEQKLLLRVIVVLPIYAILYFISLVFYPTYIYLQNLPKVMEAVAFVALFQLCIEYAAGHDKDQQDLFFMNLDRYKSRGIISRIRNPKAPDELLHHHGSLRWYKGITAAIVQFVVVYSIWIPIYIIATALLCPTSKVSKIIKVLDTVINTLTTTVAILGLARFYIRLRPELKAHHAVRKVFIFKKVIGIALTQSFLLGVISSAGAIVPTWTMTMGDFLVGVPAFMTCCEMMIFSATFAWAYNASEYKQLAHASDREGLLPPSAEKADGYDSNPIHKTSAFKLILAAFNIWDVLKLIGRSVSFLAGVAFGQKKYAAVGAEQMYKQQNAGNYSNYSSGGVNGGYGGMAPPRQPEAYHPTMPTVGGAENQPLNTGTQASWTGPAPYSAEEQHHQHQQQQYAHEQNLSSNNPYETGYADGGLAPGEAYGSREASPEHGPRTTRDGY